jgi:hypothetical protein
MGQCVHEAWIKSKSETTMPNHAASIRAEPNA